VGLNYLSLDRSADTLSGGEAQRIRLASQIGSGLTGVMYVLDEPSIGLHQRDNDRLIATLKHLRDIGNSVIVVEHDEDMMRAADQSSTWARAPACMAAVMAQGTSTKWRRRFAHRPVPERQRRIPCRAAHAWLPLRRKQARPSAPARGAAAEREAAHTRCRRCAWWRRGNNLRT
jgi:excinuclease ABC subunit A